MKNRVAKNKSFLLTFVIDIVLIIAIFYLMNYVKYILSEDVRINLTEIVTQNKDVITSNLTVELNNLELDAKQLAGDIQSEEDLTDEGLLELFNDYVNKKGDTSLVFALKSGMALSGEGKAFDISGRNYFKLGMEGTPSVSDRVISRANGEDVFVFCVPIYYGDEIVGTIQKQYTPQQMYSLCSVSLFSEQGSTYIINSQGYILVCSEESKYTKESDNYYRIIYLTDPDASKSLEQDIQNNRSGFMEAVIDGKKVFSAYTPIDKIHDWYLISSIATSAVSPNANVVVRLFYFILFAVALLFSFILLYYWRLKRNQQQRLEHIAFIDTVTNGDSFTKFTVNLREILQKCPDSQFHIFSLDIDNFKYINRFYGFETGDKILKEIYNSYSSKLSENERIARITSDRFILLLEDVSADRLNGLIDFEPVFCDIKIYISVGAYTISNPEESVNLMLDKADTASQKNKGMHFKEVAFYTEVFDQKIARDEQLKRAVELALSDDEIIPFFQPKVDINTRKLVGAEALARWRTKDGKLVSPGEFIPVCEQTGLITLVDMAIFEKTLQFIKTHLDNGDECVPISVNFSRMHLLNDIFLDTIIKKLDAYNIPAELIEIELTETVIFDNFQTINTFINDLHAHGLKISMDDFGSGYSSLHMLKDVDIDVLKIDRGFLLGSSSNERQRTIFGTIVQMAEKLKMKVIVEGVETDENVKLMNEFGCNNAQGFYFARPMEQSEFDKIYKEGYVCSKS